MARSNKPLTVQFENSRTNRYFKVKSTKRKSKIVSQKKTPGPYKGIPVLEGIHTDPIPVERKTEETVTVSDCCSSLVYVSTKNDFAKINKKDSSSWLMTIEFICHKCGKECSVKEIPVSKLGNENKKRKFNLLSWIKKILGC